MASDLITARYRHTATLLPNGIVLVAGGNTSSSRALESTELYNPAIRSWSFAGNLKKPRNYHTTTLLPDGKVLVVGPAQHYPEDKTAEVGSYMPANSFTAMLELPSGWITTRTPSINYMATASDAPIVARSLSNNGVYGEIGYQS